MFFLKNLIKVYYKIQIETMIRKEKKKRMWKIAKIWNEKEKKAVISDFFLV